ncbi:sialate O-acetylesterase [Puniceicoccus vermicola]|uniref:9-O-acetylesterase n=1 Tax=Puniceicoccus vermicola TaxID=388746 RepID=A0A7X1AZA6_9BACT|nr:sialate O-acetylesterase [Puniceicoccus vermicola]MBC2602699.1 9-O-acetylesterase [Puniceicoccus vermicola]
MYKTTPSRLRSYTCKCAAIGLTTGIGLFFGASSALAELKLPAIFGSHMVLQQDGTIPVWGWSDPGETVTVSFAEKSAKVKASEDGTWRVELPAIPANSEAQVMTISDSSGDQVTFEDVLVGEVWICSGQSNMEWSLNRAANAEEEIANANYPEIRLFDVKNQIAYAPQEDLEGKWVVCTPGTAKNFSAVGYFFGRHLYNELQQPVGLISTNWGGTIAEAWTSAEALEANLPEFSQKIADIPNLPAKNAEAVQTYQQDLSAYRASLTELYSLEADLASAQAWAQPDLDDSEWTTMPVPQNWEKSGLPGYGNLDGIVWYRKTVDIPESWVGRDLALRPGPIDEVDVTWFNGKEVGASGNISEKNVDFWDKPRNYTVPGELVQAGPNVIAIRVIDAAGQGGLWGQDASQMTLSPVEGTDAESIALAGEWKAKPEFALLPKPKNPNSPNYPTVLYNQMIAPLIPYGIRGAIWYQGESNAGRPEQYQTLLPTMIEDWRERWDRGDFPFLVVQLANFRAREEKPAESNWAELREAQSMTAANDPQVGLAVIIDIGEANNIHPKNKQDVGKRLGLQAEEIAYGHNIVANGPTFASLEIEDNEAVLTFENAEGGIVAQGDTENAFAICGPDGKFVWADSVTVDGNTIRVSTETIDEPEAVRYGWANNPVAPFYNEAGLPMAPFRTDGPTEAVARDAAAE